MDDGATCILPSTSIPKSSSNNRNACLVHIYPSGPGMGTRRTLSDAPQVIGRDEDCHIHIDDESVSRKHACIQPEGDGFSVIDLQSTNGTYVNNVRIDAHKLNDGEYLHIGPAIYRFLTGDNLEAAYHEEIYRLTIIDALTGIHNKRYLLEFLGRELSCSVRYRRPLSLVMIDIDRFKSINDKYGHLCGDFALRELASIIKGTVRKEDLFARYGGEEFSLVMSETNMDGALQIAERIRVLVESNSFMHDRQRIAVTISLGLASMSGEEWLTTNELIHQADQKLLQAKQQGRNRVVS